MKCLMTYSRNFEHDRGPDISRTGEINLTAESLPPNKKGTHYVFSLKFICMVL